MNLTEAIALAEKHKPTNEELAALLDYHLDIPNLEKLPTAKLEHYREAAAQAAVVVAAMQTDTALEFNVREWILGFPPTAARLSFVHRITGLKKEIGYPETGL